MRPRRDGTRVEKFRPYYQVLRSKKNGESGRIFASAVPRRNSLNVDDEMKKTKKYIYEYLRTHFMRNEERERNYVHVNI